ncbi:hypothetical protein [Labedaea rhizosphaerae]|uniref:Uncharacterized protein n=1 Tax=Labedaea rhizosphaerae TaxID=598644 RepID=A0A4R6SIF9_LABRH|nr:hypothetical protein [Labedaea rhizosphaerae]TDQ01176.1 hypothetical protein EV186_1021043 [Labedaea rhizosphaerae]
MIDLPPRRSLPPQVRDKMLVDLREKLDEKPRRSNTPYAVAAGVAALVAGGVVAVTTLQGGGDGTDTASGKVTGNTKGVEIAAQRCHDASKKVGGFPAKADWRVVAHIAAAGYTDLAVRVGDRPVFCEVTATSVTLSKFDARPAYVPGTKTGVLVETPGHVLGLVVDPSWHGMDAYEGGTTGNNRDSGGPDNLGYGSGDDMVVWMPEYPFAKRFVAPPKDKHPTALPAAPGDNTATVLDRPGHGPAPDRTSAAGKLVAACIERDAKAGHPLPDPDTWQTGPMLTGDTDAIVVIRGLQQVTTCSREGTPSIGLSGGALRVAALPKGNRPAVAIADRLLVRNNENRDILFGSVPLNAASMTAVTGEHRTVTAQVADGMFIADARATPENYDDFTPYAELVSVTVKDKDGKVLYQGKPGK